jgi:hypothetical protein
VAARTAPTVADLCDRYLAEYAVAPNKAASSIRMDQINIRLHVKPQLGKLRVDAVQRQHIRGLKTAGVRLFSGHEDPSLDQPQTRLALARNLEVRDSGLVVA